MIQRIDFWEFVPLVNNFVNIPVIHYVRDIVKCVEEWSVHDLSIIKFSLYANFFIRHLQDLFCFLSFISFELG